MKTCSKRFTDGNVKAPYINAQIKPQNKISFCLISQTDTSHTSEHRFPALFLEYLVLMLVFSPLPAHSIHLMNLSWVESKWVRGQKHYNTQDQEVENQDQGWETVLQSNWLEKNTVRCWIKTQATLTLTRSKLLLTQTSVLLFDLNSHSSSEQDISVPFPWIKLVLYGEPHMNIYVRPLYIRVQNTEWRASKQSAQTFQEHKR